MPPGSYWLGAAVGAALTLVLLDTDLFPADVGWRLAFGLGAILGLVILLVRRNVPESPRWLTIHGRHEEAEVLLEQIESTVERRDELKLSPVPPEQSIEIHERGPVKVFEIIRTMVRTYPSRSALGLGLFVGQAFLYNAVFFTQGLVLTTFFGIGSGTAGLYIIPLALGNFLGPLILGPFFDTIGRRMMITLSYCLSAVFLVITAFLFQQEVFSALTLTIAWSVVFFFASAGASSAYLTVSEIFPMETRAMAIAFFYAVGTGLGGIIGPLLFGRLVETESFGAVAGGYYLGAALMMAAGLLEWWIGVDAENRNLEDIAAPLSARAAANPQP